ncbi:MAG: hypothetical protein ACI9JM_001908 [Halioglobus sp.]|jgi:hypothetical protein
MPDIFLAMLAMVLGAMAFQHFRNLWLRRVSAQDQQNLLHSAEACYVITLFKIKSGQKIVGSARRFIEQLSAAGPSR